VLFYDFEVFKEDWLVVIVDMTKKCEYVIINDPEKLKQIYEEYKFDVWVGFNNRHYDMYIMKAILLDMNPKKVNDWIILKGKEGWQFSSLFNKIPMTNYDVMMATGRIGLKTIEAFLGANIKETDVPFDIDRKLTQEEIDETVKYCKHDVEMTIEAFFQTIDVWNAMYGIVKAFPDMVDLSDVGDTEARITAKVLGCRKQNFNDEFDYFFLPCIQLKKYKYVQDWFEQKKKEAKELGLTDKDEYTKKAWYQSQSLETMVAGIPHTFGFGGLHGAIDGAIHLTAKDGAGYHVDVNNYYPSLLNAWGLVTRAATNDNYLVVYNTRKKLKTKQQNAKTKEEVKKYKKMQLPYKKMLNALSGGMKDKTNPAYDPRNNNCMCINGQLMLLDLIEHLEVIPGFRLVQSNTDGLIVWIPDTDEAFEMMDDICWEWEKRCSTDICDIRLAFDSLKTIYQKDVNNYLFVQDNGDVERIGRYLKQLSPIDNDLPILNKALVEYMVNGTPVEDTINNCNDLGMFQKIVKLSNLYDHVEHEHCKPKKVETGVRVIKSHYEYDKTITYTYKSYRVFASLDDNDGRLMKVRNNGKKEKFGSTPSHCFIFNDETKGVPVPEKLDKQYYIDEVKRTMKMFGIAG
jgi:hypothetical protein